MSASCHCFQRAVVIIIVIITVVVIVVVIVIIVIIVVTVIIVIMDFIVTVVIMFLVLIIVTSLSHNLRSFPAFIHSNMMIAVTASKVRSCCIVYSIDAILLSDPSLSDAHLVSRPIEP